MDEQDMDRKDLLSVLMPERTKQIALAWSILRESHLAEDAYQDMLAKVVGDVWLCRGQSNMGVPAKSAKEILGRKDELRSPARQLRRGDHQSLLVWRLDCLPKVIAEIVEIRISKSTARGGRGLGPTTDEQRRNSIFWSETQIRRGA
jgi:hypothetical protein